MYDRFVITGYPRSRTAWLANLFTYGTCFCLHDGLQHGANFWDVVEASADCTSGVRHVGNSDSGIALLFAPEELRGTKVIIVERERSDALESYQRYFEKHPYPGLGVPDRRKLERVFEMAETKIRLLKETLPRETVRTVSYQNLEAPDSAEALWNFIAPDEAFNRQRFEMLNGIRMNTISSKVRCVWA